jgi:hypothetical protein
MDAINAGTTSAKHAFKAIGWMKKQKPATYVRLIKRVVLNA